MADSKLASEIGVHVARLVHAELDEIGRAVSLDVGQVSFSVTCTFQRDKEGVLTVRLQPRKRIPQADIDIKLVVSNGQLSLFE
jgi:hypothetical protein